MIKITKSGISERQDIAKREPQALWPVASTNIRRDRDTVNNLGLER